MPIAMGVSFTILRLRLGMVGLFFTVMAVKIGSELMKRLFDIIQAGYEA
jgi:hypothetical protein